VDGETISFDHAIIATGANAHLPPLKGNGIAEAWTNADVFKETTIPKEITFVGAGAISCELVQMFTKLGTRCRILERGDRILKRVDEECALKIEKKMIEEGVDLQLGVTFDTVDKNDEGFTIRYSHSGTFKELKTPHLLIATGRSANTEGLGLEKIGVDFDRNGIHTDETLQTTQPHIYAVGDCNTGPKFAHWASYEAGIAIHNIYAPSKHRVDPGKLSWVLFSDPQIASAGLSESAARMHGIEVEIERYDYSIDARAQLDKAEMGILKFIIEKKSGIIRGVQILSEKASALSGEAALIVANEMSVRDVMKGIYPHPTLTDAFGTLSQQIFMKQMMQRRRG
jgi:dihydrolipoamide dehydrogenase